MNIHLIKLQMSIFFIYVFIACISKLISADNNTTTTTIRPTLNTNAQLSQFWIITRITVPQTSQNDIIKNVSFINTMEDKLAAAYNDAFKIQLARNSVKRKKRAASSESITLQVIILKRSVNNNNVDIVYYVQQGGALVTSTVQISTMNVLTAQQLAIKLGYPVVTVAESYEATLSTGNNQAWIIGVVLGSLAGILLIIWIVLFVYCRCLIPQPKLIMPDDFADDGLVESEKNDHEQLTKRHVLSSNESENYQSKAALKQNMNLAFIVDEVAMKLDNKVAQMVNSRVSEELYQEKRFERRQASLSPSDDSLQNDDAYITNRQDRHRRRGHKKRKSTVAPRHFNDDKMRKATVSLDAEVAQKSDIERWRNKQRLREKKIDDSEVADISEEQYSYSQSYVNDEATLNRKFDSSSEYHDNESILKSVKVLSENSGVDLSKDEVDAGDLLEEMVPAGSAKHLPIQVKTSLRPDALRTAELVNSFSEEYELATICEKIKKDSARKQVAHQIIDVRSNPTPPPPPPSKLNESSEVNELKEAVNLSTSETTSPRKSGNIIQVTPAQAARNIQHKSIPQKDDIIHVAPAPVQPLFKQSVASSVSESPGLSAEASESVVPKRRLNDQLTDEMDVVSSVAFADALRPGTDAKHLVNSIRAELDRLKQDSEYSTV